MINPIDMKYVYKRERYLEKNSSTLNESVIDLDNVNPNSVLYEHRISTFMKSQPSYQNILSLLEKVYFDNKLSLLESLTTSICNDYIPGMGNNDIPGFIAKTSNSNIGDVNKDRLIETAKMYKSIDRIIKNHKALNEKFPSYDNTFSNKAKSDKDKCYTICEFCDTYSLSPFIKMNIALEEMMYRRYTEETNITEESIVENTLNYFLLRDDNTKEDIESYKKCLSESKVLSKVGKEHGLSFVNESNSFIKINTWRDDLRKWMLSSNKDKDSLFNLVRENVNNLSALKAITETCDDFIRVNSSPFTVMDAFKSISEVTTNEASNMRQIINESFSNIKDSEDLIESLDFIYESEINTQTYNDYEDNDQTFTSSEIDKFKMQNLISDSINAGEFLDQMEKSSMKESPLKFKSLINFTDGNLSFNESNINDYVDNNEHISIKLRSYLYEGSLDDVKDFGDAAIKTINNMLYGRDSYAYYNIIENTLNFFIRSKYSVLLSEAQYNARDLNIDDKITIIELFSDIESVNEICESGIDLIMDKLNDRHYAATVSANEVANIAEIMSPYITEDYDFISNFLETCKEEANPSYDYMIYLVSSIDREPFDINENHTERISKCLEVMGLTEAKKEKDEEKSSTLDRIKNNIKASVDDLNVVKKVKNHLDKKNKKDEDDVEVKSKDKKPSKKDLSPHNTDNLDSVTKAKPNKPNKDDSEDEESPKKSSKEDEKEDKLKKAPFNMNDVKLAWKAARSKLKGLDAKQADICKDMDMTFNRLCGTIDTIVEPNSKESLITGKVKFSISKLIKSAILLAGTGAATGAAFGINPLIVPIAAVISKLARSSYLNGKNKQELLDEIDIELKVLDRELARAEQDGSANKYRQLLAIQRTLQRKRQELYFNLAKKSKPLPLGARAGQQKGED